ncbi:MAG TPA: ATP-binding protein, partial [Fimbriimonadaceae bacterium]|nr:ATP-binding protein [Fimbriimonadaceae bacterium]
MRTYMRSMSIASRTILEDYRSRLDTEGDEALESIILNAKQASQLVDGLLEFTRLGRHEISKEVVGLSSMADDLAEVLSETEFNRPIEFDIEPGLTAYADPRLLRVVVANLLENGCKYQPRAGTGRVLLRKLEDHEGLDQFCVSDNGVGFDMAFAHKLFKPFERLHRDADFPGNGIGLANVRRIIDKHGGHVWAESREKEGANFYFTLPQAPADAEAQP